MASQVERNFFCVLIEYTLLHSILSLNETHIAQDTDCVTLYDLHFSCKWMRKDKAALGKGR